MKTRNLMLTLVLAGSLGLVACQQDYGKTVEQGRCVAFENDKVTFVLDTNVNPKEAPKYSDKVRTFSMPTDPKEIGPAPEAGNFISVDADKGTIQVFVDGAVQTIAVADMKAQKGLESHDPLVKGKKFPMVNKEKNEITVYSRKTLVTFPVPQALANVDENFWKMGDNVRVFTKEEGKALRFMNITKTNIFKK